MTLKDFFSNLPRGSKAALAVQLGISRTWMAQIISGREAPGPELCKAIEVHTYGRVTRAELRPDLFGGLL
jgi:DNA-binding transcriptional regulator YdaS (Cro superfamily)